MDSLWPVTRSVPRRGQAQAASPCAFRVSGPSRRQTARDACRRQGSARAQVAVGDETAVLTALGAPVEARFGFHCAAGRQRLRRAKNRSAARVSGRARRACRRARRRASPGEAPRIALFSLALRRRAAAVREAARSSQCPVRATAFWGSSTGPGMSAYDAARPGTHVAWPYCSRRRTGS